MDKLNKKTPQPKAKNVRVSAQNRSTKSPLSVITNAPSNPELIAPALVLPSNVTLPTRPVQPVDMTDKGIALRWRNYDIDLVEAVQKELYNPCFTDMTITCGNTGHRVGAHQLIVAAFSTVLREMIMERAAELKPNVTIFCQDKEILDAIMEFIYTGTVTIPGDKFNAFFVTCKELKLKGISNSDEILCDIPSDTVPKKRKRVESLQQPVEVPAPQTSSAPGLSLLANAAILDTVFDSNSRRKSAPRKIPTQQDEIKDMISYFNGNRHQFNGPPSPSPSRDMSSPESEAMNLSIKDNSSPVTSPPVPIQNSAIPLNVPRLPAEANPLSVVTTPERAPPSEEVKKKYVARANLISIPDPRAYLNRNHTATTSEDIPGAVVTPPSSAESGDVPPPALGAVSPSSGGSSEAGAPLAENGENVPQNQGGQQAPLDPNQPENMAKLLGPTWKSRQPRLCSLCNRMFSNKFNLKQVRKVLEVLRFCIIKIT